MTGYPITIRSGPCPVKFHRFWHNHVDKVAKYISSNFIAIVLYTETETVTERSSFFRKEIIFYIPIAIKTFLLFYKINKV